MEFHKCGKPDCLRKVSLGSVYCCPSCATAAEASAPYEIEPYDPDVHPLLMHSKECEERAAQRGEYSALEADLFQAFTQPGRAPS
jgi:hypothetical protein